MIPRVCPCGRPSSVRLTDEGAVDHDELWLHLFGARELYLVRFYHPLSSCAWTRGYGRKLWKRRQEWIES